MDGTASLLQSLLAFVWAPALVMAGVLDWALHRHLRIEASAGLPETLLHLVMLALLGSAILGALFLAPTAGMLAVLLALVLLHEAVYLLDLRVALARRDIPAMEQWVHGFQHLLPWAGVAGVMALSPGQALALAQLPGEVADWSLRLKPQPPPWAYVGALLAASAVFNVLPFAEENWRAWRAWRAGAVSPPRRGRRRAAGGGAPAPSRRP